MADARRITFTSEQTRGVGTSFDCLTRLGPFRTVDRMTVTEWEPGQAMGIEHPAWSPARAASRSPRTARDHLLVDRGAAIPVVDGRPDQRSRPGRCSAVWRRNLRRLRQLVEDA
jgi:hypothetical protein